MFKHILLPTDGSALSTNAAQKSLAFAHEIGATVTALHVRPVYHISAIQAEATAYTGEQLELDSEAQSRAYLADVQAIAATHGVACDTVCVEDDHPYQAIIRIAREWECDLVTMASHGRKGVAGLLLGSETQKVLSHSQIPVLVYR